MVARSSNLLPIVFTLELVSLLALAVTVKVLLPTVNAHTGIGLYALAMLWGGVTLAVGLIATVFALRVARRSRLTLAMSVLHAPVLLLLLHQGVSRWQAQRYWDELQQQQVEFNAWLAKREYARANAYLAAHPDWMPLPGALSGEKALHPRLSDGPELVRLCEVLKDRSLSQHSLIALVEDDPEGLPFLLREKLISVEDLSAYAHDRQLGRVQVERLLSLGVDPASRDEHQRTLLMDANDDTVPLLYTRSPGKTWLEETDDQGYTALLHIVTRGEWQAASFLLEQGADPDHSAPDGASVRTWSSAFAGSKSEEPIVWFARAVAAIPVGTRTLTAK